jgi:hypothetical protein
MELTKHRELQLILEENNGLQQSEMFVQNIAEGFENKTTPADPNSTTSASNGNNLAVIVIVSILSTLLLIIVAAIWVNYLHRRKLRLIYEQQNKVVPLNTKAGETLNTEN